MDQAINICASYESFFSVKNKGMKGGLQWSNLKKWPKNHLKDSYWDYNPYVIGIDAKPPATWRILPCLFPIQRSFECHISV